MGTTQSLLVRLKKPVKPQKKKKGEVICVSFPDFEWIEAFSSNTDLVSWSTFVCSVLSPELTLLPDPKSQQLSRVNDGRFPRCSSRFQHFIHGRSSCIMDYLECAGEWPSLPSHRKKSSISMFVSHQQTTMAATNQLLSVLIMWSIKFGKIVKNVDHSLR